ncbi:hypothetical protein C8J57DRAFT_1518799 [Mycena rebaudengoi]|nr:hypothetical protein C8J57DRAFT_1518799 [Mycena rebaudengoi]
MPSRCLSRALMPLRPILQKPNMLPIRHHLFFFTPPTIYRAARPVLPSTSALPPLCYINNRPPPSSAPRLSQSMTTHLFFSPPAVSHTLFPTLHLCPYPPSVLPLQYTFTSATCPERHIILLKLSSRISLTLSLTPARHLPPVLHRFALGVSRTTCRPSSIQFSFLFPSSSDFRSQSAAPRPTRLIHATWSSMFPVSLPNRLPRSRCSTDTNFGPHCSPTPPFRNKTWPHTPTPRPRSAVFIHSFLAPPCPCSLHRFADSTTPMTRPPKLAFPDEPAMRDSSSWPCRQLPCAGKGVLGLDVRLVGELYRFQHRGPRWRAGDNPSLLATLTPHRVIYISHGPASRLTSSQTHGGALLYLLLPSAPIAFSCAHFFLPPPRLLYFFTISARLSLSWYDAASATDPRSGRIYVRLGYGHAFGHLYPPHGHADALLLHFYCPPLLSALFLPCYCISSPFHALTPSLPPPLLLCFLSHHLRYALPCLPLLPAAPCVPSRRASWSSFSVVHIPAPLLRASLPLAVPARSSALHADPTPPFLSSPLSVSSVPEVGTIARSFLPSFMSASSSLPSILFLAIPAPVDLSAHYTLLLRPFPPHFIRFSSVPAVILGSAMTEKPRSTAVCGNGGCAKLTAIKGHHPPSAGAMPSGQDV